MQLEHTIAKIEGLYTQITGTGGAEDRKAVIRTDSSGKGPGQTS